MAGIDARTFAAAASSSELALASALSPAVGPRSHPHPGSTSIETATTNRRARRRITPRSSAPRQTAVSPRFGRRRRAARSRGASRYLDCRGGQKFLVRGRHVLGVVLVLVPLGVRDGRALLGLVDVLVGNPLSILFLHARHPSRQDGARAPRRRERARRGARDRAEARRAGRARPGERQRAGPAAAARGRRADPDPDDARPRGPGRALGPAPLGRAPTRRGGAAAPSGHEGGDRAADRERLLLRLRVPRAGRGGGFRGPWGGSPAARSPGGAPGGAGRRAGTRRAATSRRRASST